MRLSRIQLHICFSFLFILGLASCGGPQTLRSVFTNQTPYERYVAKLKDAKLGETALGRDWIMAGEIALHDSITVTLPYRETGYFSADKPKALGYRIDAQRGERIVVNLEMKARQAVQVFMDIFEESDTNPEHVASADTTSNTLSYEIGSDAQHILRVQPELLRSGQYTITIKSEPTLAFPVAGKTSRNIASIWGDPRDGGARNHEGIDVFAKRGTPALASAAGIVSRVGTTPRGGNVVWLTDPNHRQSLYYAHLDSWVVSAGQRVQVGDTIGFIGNTGNAKTTNPHLHFGIYQYGKGATNPYPYIHTSSKQIAPVQVDVSQIGNWVRIRSNSANLRLQPSTKSSVYKQLPKDTPLFVTGASANWYRVVLPSGSEAFIASSIVEAASNPINHEKLKNRADLLDNANTGAAAKEILNAGSSVAVLGKHNGYTFVATEKGETGWLPTSSTLGAR